jgi:hypothetical protein
MRPVALASLLLAVANGAVLSGPTSSGAVRLFNNAWKSIVERSSVARSPSVAEEEARNAVTDWLDRVEAVTGTKKIYMQF